MSINKQTYYPINSLTKEVLAPVLAEYRGGIHHIPKDALKTKPLEPKKGHAIIAVLGEGGKAIDSTYIEDHRGVTIYDESNCFQSDVVRELGPIKDSFTLSKPTTQFDQWINNTWVTNLQNQYESEYNRVDDARRGLYTTMVDPLFAEANVKVLMGAAAAEINEINTQALAARQKIQTDNPWPVALKV
ncbi:MAG: hypothetical protein JKY55_13560 [Aliivibrio sp.]|uniref:hypothetical protein n=1 Tax=Aliivibrio sp. TaxID=1872443 RepID=UPI001A3AE34D|nr:hypothetical protein [Aliivibrio sp.]